MKNKYLIRQIRRYLPLGRLVCLFFVFGGIFQTTQAQVQDMGVTALVAPTSTMCATSNKTVIVTIKNYAVTNIDFTSNPTNVVAKIIGAIAQSFTVTVSTGTLVASGTMNVAITTAGNFSTSGTYTVNAKTSVASDVNPINDSMPPAIVSVPSPVVKVNPPSATICPAGSVQLNANGVMIGPNGLVTVGTGTITNTSSTYPTPYGNYYYGARHQMLVTASELTAAGLAAGSITSLAFDVSNVNAAVTHDGFTIQIGPTSLTSITAFQTGLTMVYGPVNYQPVLGWNTHNFSTSFVWDGSSNIIVETCFTNTAFDDNASVRQSTTSYTSTIWYRQDAGFSCGNTTVTGSISRRPNMRFMGTAMAPANLTYSWASASGLSNPSVSNPIASPSATTTYSVTGTASNGCTNTATVTVTVNAKPAANAGNDITICSGQSATLIGSGGTGYSWSTGQTTTSIVVSPSAFSTYTLIVTGGNGCTASDVVTVTVNPPVASANAGNDVTICEAWSVLLSGSGGSNYLWSTGKTTASIVVSPTVNTTYTLVVSNSYGCSKSDEVTVTVNPAPAAHAGSDGTICNGQTILLSGSGNGSYSWSPSTGLICTTCSSTGASPTVTTTYSLTTTNNCGSVSDAVTVTVDVPAANAGSDVTTCPGGSVMLNGTGNGTYNWAPATGLSCTKCPDPIASPSSTITYTLTAKGDCGNASDEITLVVDPSATATANAGNDVTICASGSTMLNATGSGSYSWSPATGLSCTTCPNPVANPVSTTTYTLMVTSSCGNASDEVVITVDPSAATANAGTDVTICKNTSTTLNATGNGSYSWAPSAGLSCTTCANPTASPSVSTSYTLTVSASCGTATDEVFVTWDPCLTGIALLMSEDELKIVPNPGPGLFFLMAGETILGETQIEVINIQGKTIYNEKRAMLNKEGAQIDLTATAPGMYFLKVNNTGGSTVRKIVINR